MMIEQPGEVLTNVEQQVEQTVVDLEQGNKDVEKAIVSARATRAVSLLSLCHSFSRCFYLCL